jgi:hypothetical protein
MATGWAQDVVGVLGALSSTARDDLIAVSLLDLAAQDPGLEIPAPLQATLASFLRRAAAQDLSDPGAIRAALQAYLAKAPLDPGAVSAIQRALREALSEDPATAPIDLAAALAFLERGPAPSDAIAADPLARFKLNPRK